MAIRPLFPCFAANIEKIQWGSISNYFNFNTITEEEKRTNLETNIRLLIEEQLKLPSGQNLWKAFQFWEKQHKGLAFRFKFSLMDSTGAHVELKKYEDESQTFIFEIAINKVFAEDFKIPFWQVIKNNLQQKTNLGFKKLLNENMLYRPCLIKLVDSDDPDNWHYHLREQKLPFFVTLAHEFLHVLNQLECIEWLIEKNEDFSSPKSKIQDFLFQKMNLRNNTDILKKQYKKLWENDDFDDSLDEMTVILGSKHEIEDNIFKSIGESTFLREYYNDDSIVS